MTRLAFGIELGVSAKCRIQTDEIDIFLCYAKLTSHSWGFCDESRRPVRSASVPLQRILWNLLPDLILAIAAEAERIADEMATATAFLREGLRLYDEQQEEKKRLSMLGLS